MVDSERLARYIRELENHLDHARQLQKIDKKAFLADWKIYDLEILSENGVITEDLGDKLVELAKFRNVLVHEYLFIDHARGHPRGATSGVSDPRCAMIA
ncbi:MAG TPA: DUF86 domain-containing protein, partial [Desulfobacterales bacterium]|nr:DUF86 domain-containing protein [Desulfobacterales bacterium]